MTLAGWLAWLGAAGCTCRHAWRSLGRGYGHGWVRLSTDPACPVHGPAGRWPAEHEAALARLGLRRPRRGV